MMPPRSCSTPGMKPGTSTSVTSGMLKQLQKRMKRAPLSAASMSSAPARTAGLVGDDADHYALDPTETDDDVLGEGTVHLEEFTGIDNVLDDAVHVHRPLRIVRD